MAAATPPTTRLGDATPATSALAHCMVAHLRLEMIQEQNAQQTSKVDVAPFDLSCTWNDPPVAHDGRLPCATRSAANRPVHRHVHLNPLKTGGHGWFFRVGMLSASLMRVRQASFPGNSPSGEHPVPGLDCRSTEVLFPWQLVWVGLPKIPLVCWLFWFWWLLSSSWQLAKLYVVLPFLQWPNAEPWFVEVLTNSPVNFAPSVCNDGSLMSYVVRKGQV